MMNIQISAVELNQAEFIKEYVKAFRIGLFPMLDSTIVPRDLLDFEQIYLLHPDGCFLQARDQHNKLIGVIGMMPYDYRFDYLDYKDKRTVEVARLFVEPAYRRSGLATKLFQALLEQATQKGIEVLYLHTHPFLTGAFEYWQKQGFELVTTTMYGEFETLHMDRVV
ncbi:GNAT family N-acetyltransferase [Myroides marinus]|uniref:Histone acetyltransferase n=1 Tax=Myroides marinus TaxID=703342 RepID=A0A164AL71_9FLAO|nr:GNAT family N-acetyltransferase [Myroides marinus]KZE84047.1 histone acetyltransferase [Myroides marinus]